MVCIIIFKFILGNFDLVAFNKINVKQRNLSGMELKFCNNNRSEVSLHAEIQAKEVVPLDSLIVKFQYIRLIDEEPKGFSVKVTFQDQLILTGIVHAVGARAEVKKKILIRGTLNYDPSDYEKMCLMVDSPLCVTIQPIAEPSPFSVPNVTTSDNVGCLEDISACNIDIIRLLLDKEKMVVRKRMEPLIEPSILNRKSWDNLPLIGMKLRIARDTLNKKYHEVIKRANFMKMTLIASYNMITSYDDGMFYMAASKMPVHNETNLNTVVFTQGYRVSKDFNSTQLYPKWESLRTEQENFVKGDGKLEYNLEELQNDNDIPLKLYMNKTNHITVWGSFHRTLLLEESEAWFSEHIRQYYWPLELHMYGDKGGYSFMAFLNLFKLLYPGEDTVRLAVPLEWINSDTMMDKCGCEIILTPNEKVHKFEYAATNEEKDRGDFIRSTGSDENKAFVVVEIKLARPLKKISVPEHIPSAELNTMLKDMEQAGPYKRYCTGRGQNDRDWETTVQIAAKSLRRVPYYGVTEFSALTRQLSETRTRVEITTSFWQDAAVYVNNHFVVQHFLHSDEAMEEMIMMSHACLMKAAISTLTGSDYSQKINPTLKAARHARQMQDIPHALDLYLQRCKVALHTLFQLVVEEPRSANSWRELSTCLKDVDRDWANVCINKSVVLNPRHPLSLLSKGCMLMEEDPALAEPFFIALLGLFPFWSTGWVITSAYYIERELYHMADRILEYNRLTHKLGLPEDLGDPRSWEHELGDWWDYTPILPGMNPYYDAADLLLRLRCMPLAEVCLSRALSETGESAAYFHLIGLCCRMRGNIDDALCHVRAAIDRYGEISYLRSLEAECLHKQKNNPGTVAAFEKAGICLGAYSILLSTPSREPHRARTLLVDLVRRQPSAYAWMALADDWINRASTVEGNKDRLEGDQVTARSCAVACCVQALKVDRRASRAWSILARLVKPSARRLHCLEMARACETSQDTEKKLEAKDGSKISLCYRLGKALRECRCVLCEHIQF